MYMIAGLCMLKLYQKRHPDINASAYTAYACLALVIFFSVLGVVRFYTGRQLQVDSDVVDVGANDVCRCSGKGTWFSGSFSPSSTFWPRSSSARSCTTWADGGWVRPPPRKPFCTRSAARLTLTHSERSICVCRLGGAAADRQRHLHRLHQTVQRTDVHRESRPLKRAGQKKKKKKDC